jgi:hypothetical protein
MSFKVGNAKGEVGAFGVEDVEDEVDRAHGAQDQKGAGVALGLASKAGEPVTGGGGVVQSGASGWGAAWR